MSNSSSGNGIGLGTVLFMIFMTLKLCDVIDWSWWWVASPLWVPFGIIALFFVFVAILAVITHLLKRRSSR